MNQFPELFHLTLSCLRESDPAAKAMQTRALRAAWLAGEVGVAYDSAAQSLTEPGRPARPLLVSPFAVERRSLATIEGRAALVHALAHIEFNAINLALDAVQRFRGLPREYYDDWLKVAAEEAYHFELLRDHLCSLGFDYGDFPAHNGLWEMAMKTAGDVLARMALVPRVLEARGLDASPALSAKFRGAGDARMVEILGIILRDEIGHVAIGNRWYLYFCEQRALEPLETFARLIDEYDAPRIRPPFHVEARRAAGFSDAEIEYLESCATRSPNQV